MYNRRYGKLSWPSKRLLAQSKDVHLVPELEGHRQFAGRHADDVVTVFLLPPSLDELEKPLRGRDDDTEEAVARRLAEARGEIAAPNNTTMCW